VMTNFFAKGVDFFLDIFERGHWPDYSRGRGDAWVDNESI
jgi:hypothetical protein